MDKNKAPNISLAFSDSEDPNHLLAIHDLSMSGHSSTAMFGRMMKLFAPVIRQAVEQEIIRVQEELTEKTAWDLACACSEIARNVLINMLANFLTAEGTAVTFPRLLEMMASVTEKQKLEIYEQLRKTDDCR